MRNKQRVSSGQFHGVECKLSKYGVQISGKAKNETFLWNFRKAIPTILERQNGKRKYGGESLGYVREKANVLCSVSFTASRKKC